MAPSVTQMGLHNQASNNANIQQRTMALSQPNLGECESRPSQQSTFRITHENTQVLLSCFQSAEKKLKELCYRFAPTLNINTYI